MKCFPLVLCLSVILLTACGKNIKLPKPAPEKSTTEQAEQKKIAKQKNSFLKKITNLEKELDSLGRSLLEKRGRGYNTSEAELVVEEIKKSIREAKDLLFWDKFEELELKLEEIKILRDKADHLIKKASEFGSAQPVKKEKIQRKYLDARDWVKEIRGEPDKKGFRSPFTIELRIPIPSSSITNSRCWNALTYTFVISNPPQIESWFYRKDNKIYIFMEVNSIVEQFMLRNEITDSERDRLLGELCAAQVYSGHKLIYVGPPTTDEHQIVEQVFMGQSRGADMFGVGSLDRLAKAEAALPELTVAAVAFNSEIEPLNQKQTKQMENLMELVNQANPEIAAVLTDLEQEELFDKRYEQAMTAEPPFGPTVLSTLEELKKIRTSNETAEEKKKGIKKLIERQSKEFKKRLSLTSNVLNWQRTLNPGRKDAEEMLKVFQAKGSGLEKSVQSFAKSLSDLAEQFEKLRKDLLRFNNEATLDELLFRQDRLPVVFFMLEGVRFQDKILAKGEIIEVPDISLKVKIEMKISKKEPPVFLKESKEIKITTANNFIDEVRDYRRLTSFGMRFPTTLDPGSYLVIFSITDNLRAKTIEQKISWLVVPKQE